MRWPWNKKREKEAQAVEESSTLDRLTTHNCTRDEFVLLYIKLLGERLPGVTINVVGETALQLTNTEGKQGTAYLDNFWTLYNSGTERKGHLVERYVRLAEALFETSPPLSSDTIIAIVKDATYLEQCGSPELITEHIAGDIWIVYAQDLPDRTVTVTPKRLAEASIERRDLLALSTDNLRRILPAVERHDAESWFFISAGGDYTASLVLLDEIWQSYADEVRGSLVVAVPARDVLLVTGSESASGLAALRDRAASLVSTGDHVISETLLVRSGERWTVFGAN